MGDTLSPGPASGLALLRSVTPTTWARVGLGVLGLGLLGYLLFAKKPWEVHASEGKRLKVDDFVIIYFWVGAAINLAITAILLATAGFWMRPMASQIVRGSERSPRWFWPLVILAMAILAACALPRLNDSFWDDEEYNVRHSITGRFKSGDEPGDYRFKKLGWDETFFDYREPNNHVLHSLLARGSLTIWQAISPPDDLPFTEWPLRIPAWIFGVLGVATLAWFLLDAGFPGAGVVAAFLMALHPWVLRYASEMRGYSMILALVPVIFVLWRWTICDGAWRWWLAYAAVQWAILYTYPGALLVLCTLNILGLALLAFSDVTVGPFRIQFGRWVVANALAGMALIQFMLPLLPQLQAFLEYETSRGYVIGWPWIQGTLAFVLAGTPWVGATVAHPALVTQWGGVLGGLDLVIGLAIVLGLLGALRLMRTGWIGVVLVVAVLAPPVLMFEFAMMRKHLIYSSYVIYALPGIIAFVAMGVVVVAAGLRRWRWGKLIGVAWVVAVLIGFAVFTQPTRAWLMTHPLQGIKDSVLMSRGSLDPVASREILSASFCIPPYLYDPQMTRLDSLQEFIALLHLADREKRPLVINIGMPWAARAFSPQMWALLQDDRLFENHQTLQGFDGGLDRIVATYKAESAAGFDFSGYDVNGR
jgi:hypothetical protein